MKLKKGDKVIVIAGKAKGQSGTIARALRDSDAVLIDGINTVKRHTRPTRAGGTGAIIEKPMPIHVSNVMLADPKDGKPTRIKIVRKDGTRIRMAVRSNQELK